MSLSMQLHFSGERGKYHCDKSAPVPKKRGVEKGKRTSALRLRMDTHIDNTSLLGTGSALSLQWYLPLSPLKCNCMQSDVHTIIFWGLNSRIGTNLLN